MHTFYICTHTHFSTPVISFQYLPPVTTSQHPRQPGYLRTNLLDIFFDQVRVRRSRPLTGSAIFCESAEVARMDESLENAKKRSLDNGCVLKKLVVLFVWCGEKLCVFTCFFFQICTLPESSIGHPKRKVVFQPMLVSGSAMNLSAVLWLKKLAVFSNVMLVFRGHTVIS